MTFPGVTALPVRYKLTSFLGVELQDGLPVGDAEEYAACPLKHRSVSVKPEFVKPPFNLRQHIHQDPAMMLPSPRRAQAGGNRLYDAAEAEHSERDVG